MTEEPTVEGSTEIDLCVGSIWKKTLRQYRAYEMESTFKVVDSHEHEKKITRPRVKLIKNEIVSKRSSAWRHNSRALGFIDWILFLGLLSTEPDRFFITVFIGFGKSIMIFLDLADFFSLRSQLVITL